MIQLTGSCTVKIPSDCVLQIEPRTDGTGHDLTIFKEETGEIAFSGTFGISELSFLI